MPTFSVVIGSLLSRATWRPPSPRNRQATSPRPGTRRAGCSAGGGAGPVARPRFRRATVWALSKPNSRSPVQRERVVDAMRLLRRPRDSRHAKPGPVAALRIHHENLPVEVEKDIEGWVTRLRHGI